MPTATATATALALLHTWQSWQSWPPFGLSLCRRGPPGRASRARPAGGASPATTAMLAPPRQGNHSIVLHCVKAARAIPYSVDPRPVSRPASRRHCRVPFRHSRWLSSPKPNGSSTVLVWHVLLSCLSVRPGKRPRLLGQKVGPLYRLLSYTPCPIIHASSHCITKADGRLDLASSNMPTPVVRRWIARNGRGIYGGRGGRDMCRYLAPPCRRVPSEISRTRPRALAEGVAYSPASCTWSSRWFFPPSIHT